MDVRLRATIGSSTDNVDLAGVIDLKRSFEVSDLIVRCPDLEVDRPCEVRANVRNTGTYDDVAAVNLVLGEESQGIVNMSAPTQRVVLSHGDDKDIVIALLTAHPDALAFQSATLEVFIGTHILAFPPLELQIKHQ